MAISPPYSSTNLEITIYNNNEDYNKIITYSSNSDGTTTGTSWKVENNITVTEGSLYIWVYKGGTDASDLITLIEEGLTASSTVSGSWVNITGFIDTSGGYSCDLIWTIPPELKKSNQLYFRYLDIISEPITLSIPLDVNISCSTSDSQIYYTTNGNTPTSNSNLYSTPFSANPGTTIKAIGVKEGMLDSDIATYSL